MSKGKNRYSTENSTRSYVRSPRVANVNATTVRPIVLPSVSTFTPILQLEDRRFFHPDKPFQSPRAVYRSDTRMVVKESANVRRSTSRQVQYYTPSMHVGFSRPDRVAICVRRKVRRQVLFAAGAGGKKVRRGKRGHTSGFRCN